MAEFVEQDLEELVSVLEQLQATDLLSEKEVNQLAKRCRRYDYRLAKIQKVADDYLHYIDYLTDLLVLISQRRKDIGYKHKRKLIEGKLRKKACTIYRRLTTRFKGNLSYWMRYVEFSKKNYMRIEASQAYTTAMQIHPHSIPLRISAALWELKQNGSIDNARTGLQMALRLHPESSDVWVALFEIEVEYVARLRKRNELLRGKRDKKGGAAEGEGGDSEDEAEAVVPLPIEPSTTDAVLQHRLAEIVLEQALTQFADQKETTADMLLRFWKLASVEGDAASTLRERIETLMDETDAQTQWELRMLRRTQGGEDLLDVLESMDWAAATPEQLRFAMRLCDEKKEDPLVASRALEYNKLLLQATTDATEEEYEHYLENKEDREVAEAAVKKYPARALFWRIVLAEEEVGLDADAKAADVNALAERINKAVEKCKDVSPPVEVANLYRLAIDLAVTRKPKSVEKVFSRAFDTTTGDVRTAIKGIRIEYLESLYKAGSIPAERLRKELQTIMFARPNSAANYLQMTDVLLAMEKEEKESGASTSSSPTTALVDTVTECALSEHSGDVDVWCARCAILLDRAPERVADVHRRALLALNGPSEEDFIERYTKMMQTKAEEGRRKKQ